MATARTTYQDGRGADGAAPGGDTFVWVSLRDPSPEELASVQHEFALPGPLIDDPDTSANRPALEVSGDLVFAEVKTIRWVAAEEGRKERLVWGRRSSTCGSAADALMDEISGSTMAARTCVPTAAAEDVDALQPRAAEVARRCARRLRRRDG
jgi:Mg2+ and Co2+ transporter CorA